MVVTALIVVLLDQLSKRWVERNLALYESVVPIPALREFFTITHFTNTGAAFGLFRDQSVLFVAIAVIFVLFQAWQNAADDKIAAELTAKARLVKAEQS